MPLEQDTQKGQQPMADVDRKHLPIRRPSFSGTARKTLDGSQPDWNLMGHPTPPSGAPNVLLVLIDDAGFGNPSTFGGPIETPNFTPRCPEGPSLQPVPCHRALLGDSRSAADRTQQPRSGLWLDRRVLRWLSRLLSDLATRLRSTSQDSQGQRLQHGHLREMAPDP